MKGDVFLFKEACAHGVYDAHKDTRRVAGNLLIIGCDGGPVRGLVEVESSDGRRMFVEVEHE